MNDSGCAAENKTNINHLNQIVRNQTATCGSFWKLTNNTDKKITKLDGTRDKSTTQTDGERCGFRQKSNAKITDVEPARVQTSTNISLCSVSASQRAEIINRVWETREHGGSEAMKSISAHKIYVRTNHGKDSGRGKRGRLRKKSAS